MPGTNDLRIPVAIPHQRIYLRYAPLPRLGGEFDPTTWPQADLTPDPDPAAPGWYCVDLSTLNLPDGAYEYEFVIERPGDNPLVVTDPFAEELAKLGGYRALLYIRQGQRYRPPFDWTGELPPGVSLPGNHELVIYELPMRWIDPGDDGYARQISLGTFDKAIFELLDDYIVPLGVNAVELLPVQDSPDTLNWGYGTRFFLAPDYDIGAPFDLKLFIKRCHARGIRVILDVVMNHSKKCPLEALAHPWYYIDPAREEKIGDEPRDAWGGQVFRYRDPANGSFMAREFHYRMAEFWVREYHVDGFRIDEFKGINNWDFLREFRYRALRAHRALHPDRPFIVIAEDSWRRANATQGEDRPASTHPGPAELARLRVTDAIWDFDFRDEVRRLVSNTLGTALGQPGRHERAAALLRGDRLWDGGKWREHGFTDMAQRVTYCTSHDVEAEHERRLYAFYLERVRAQWPDARYRYGLDAATVSEFEILAREMVVSTFALMLMARGIPMFLAGEEFADLHDTEPWDWRKKMSDPVDWYRRHDPGHAQVLTRVQELIRLRTDLTVTALHRNELEFFGLQGIASGFQADFDENTGGRVMAYCRTGGQALGSANQIVVLANCGWLAYSRFRLPWPWPAAMTLHEYGGKGQPLPRIVQGQAELALDRFQVRVWRLSAD